MLSKLTIVATIAVAFASTMVACGGGEDPIDQAGQYAIDPVSCFDDSDCCVVNDGCRTTAYVVASKDSSKVASLIESAPQSTCNRCVTPMIQVSCVSGACVGERMDFSCPLAPYPGNHCGKLELPSSCRASQGRAAAAAEPPVGGTSKPLAIFTCGGP